MDDLVDIVSKNGCLLLNIAPRADGTIPEPQQEILLEIGQWLAVNGEAIYGTRPWAIYGEGPTRVVGGSSKDTASASFAAQDIRFTTKDSTLYAIALAWPRSGTLTIKALGTGSPYARRHIKAVSLLGSDASLRWTQSADGLTLGLPGQKPCDHAFVFKILFINGATLQNDAVSGGTREAKVCSPDGVRRPKPSGLAAALRTGNLPSPDSRNYPRHARSPDRQRRRSTPWPKKDKSGPPRPARTPWLDP